MRYSVPISQNNGFAPSMHVPVTVAINALNTKHDLQISLSSSICNRGHQFPVIDDILDLLPEIKDSKHAQ